MTTKAVKIVAVAVACAIPLLLQFIGFQLVVAGIVGPLMDIEWTWRDSMMAAIFISILTREWPLAQIKSALIEVNRYGGNGGDSQGT